MNRFLHCNHFYFKECCCACKEVNNLIRYKRALELFITYTPCVVCRTQSEENSFMFKVKIRKQRKFLDDLIQMPYPTLKQ